LGVLPVEVSGNTTAEQNNHDNSYQAGLFYHGQAFRNNLRYR
jgi:hypothetical protein